MNAAVLAAAGVSFLAAFLFIAESQTLSEGHARARVQFFNAARWAFVVALSWVLIPASDAAPGPERVATIIGLTVLIGVVILIPLRWFVRIGGRQGAWELRRAKLEVSRLANRIRHDRDSVTPARIRQAADRVRNLRTPETAELCDLMIAELDDLMAGEELWLESGRRSIRLDYLARALWWREMPPPDNDPDEATFRWYLYRIFGRMMELGLTDPSKDDLGEFRHLMDSLEQYRRPDTKTFIEAVLRSATTWLADTSAGPWIRSYEFEALGPSGLEEIQWIWGREAAMWGAYLDGDDLRAIRQDLSRRAAAADSAPPAGVVAEETASQVAAAAKPSRGAAKSRRRRSTRVPKPAAGQK